MSISFCFGLVLIRAWTNVVLSTALPLATFNTKHLVEPETRGWKTSTLNTKPGLFNTLDAVDWTAILNVVELQFLVIFFPPMLGNVLSLHCKKYCTKFVRSVKWTIIQAVISRASSGRATLVCSCNETVALIAFLFARKLDLKTKVSFFFLMSAAMYVARWSCSCNTPGSSLSTFLFLKRYFSQGRHKSRQDLRFFVHFYSSFKVKTAANLVFVSLFWAVMQTKHKICKRNVLKMIQRFANKTL